MTSPLEESSTFIPLSLKGEGEEFLERGEAPLFPTPPLPLLREGVRGIGCQQSQIGHVYYLVSIGMMVNSLLDNFSVVTSRASAS